MTAGKLPCKACQGLFFESELFSKGLNGEGYCLECFKKLDNKTKGRRLDE
jgi:hypothetical protein